MEISSNYKDYKNEYLERAQTEQDKVKRTSNAKKIMKSFKRSLKTTLRWL